MQRGTRAIIALTAVLVTCILHKGAIADDRGGTSALIELDVEGAIRELRETGLIIFKLYRESAERDRSESVIRLADKLADLAGKKRAFAVLIENSASDDWPLPEEQERAIVGALEKVSNTTQEALKLANDLDPRFSGKNLQLRSRISKQMALKEAFMQSADSELKRVMQSGPPDKQQYIDIANRFRNYAKQLEEIAAGVRDAAASASGLSTHKALLLTGLHRVPIYLW